MHLDFMVKGFGSTKNSEGLWPPLVGYCDRLKYRLRNLNRTHQATNIRCWQPNAVGITPNAVSRAVNLFERGSHAQSCRNISSEVRFKDVTNFTATIGIYIHPIYIYIYLFIYLCVYITVCVCMYIQYVFICLCSHIYIYIYIGVWV